jgi:hypothetical protein
MHIFLEGEVSIRNYPSNKMIDMLELIKRSVLKVNYENQCTHKKSKHQMT